jgi:hypothetical protein
MPQSSKEAFPVKSSDRRVGTSGSGNRSWRQDQTEMLIKMIKKYKITEEPGFINQRDHGTKTALINTLETVLKKLKKEAKASKAKASRSTRSGGASKPSNPSKAKASRSTRSGGASKPIRRSSRIRNNKKQ